MESVIESVMPDRKSVMVVGTCTVHRTIGYAPRQTTR
jgi:hypothetical protein